MDCLACSDKQCRKSRKDCPGTKDTISALYDTEGIQRTLAHADAVASGTYGALSRIQEVVRLCRLQAWDTIGIAYCASFEKIARQASSFFTAEGIRVESCRCTVNGISGCEINSMLPDAVACNPIGQAQTLNDGQCQFVIEMGLCLGHDVLFHQHIKKPYTVLAVKDRVYRHDPLGFLEGRTPVSAVKKE